MLVDVKLGGEKRRLHMRSTNSATITFGLVSIPVKFYTAAASEAVSFKMLTPDGHTVKQKLTDAVTGAEVTHDQCDKGYEVAKDNFVRITKDELKALEVESESKTCDIVEFVPAPTVDLIAVEKSYYLGPDKGAEKGYALLSEAMANTNRMAVAQWNSRGKEHLVTIRAYKGGLVLHQMYYATEVRPFEECKPTVTKPVSDAERNMAGKLVEALSVAAFDPSKYEDHYVARVKKAVDVKVSGGTFKTATSEAPKGATVIDMASLLAASLEAAAKLKK
jgi:DNA end-binding protein Ku